MSSTIEEESPHVELATHPAVLKSTLNRLRYALAYVFYIVPLSLLGAVSCSTAALVCIPIDMFLMSVFMFNVGFDLSEAMLRGSRRCFVEIRRMHAALIKEQYDDMAHWFT